MKLVILAILVCSNTNIWANEIDIKLRDYITRFKMGPLTKIKDSNPKLTELGNKLFHDARLSRNDNISCVACHHWKFGTSDALPVSIGEGGSGIGPARLQAQGFITKRHANHVFNKGFPEFKHMFWDGRVKLETNGALKTPEPGLNGVNPTHSNIAKLLSTPLAAQAIFPISSEAEMFGINNEGFDNFEKWKIISDKIYNVPEYKKEFDALYSLLPGEFNIGHIAQALAQFQKINFQVTETPWDKYLRGDDNAMSLSQKQGAILFMSKARCVACHNGVHLGGMAFQNSASPQLIFSQTKNDDLGLFEVTGNENHKYMFRIAPLRNVVNTSPYFHNGVFTTLEQVVEHYNDPYKSLRGFNTHFTMGQYSQNYSEKFMNMTSDQIEERLKRLPMFYRHHGPLGLSGGEKTDLVNFLRYSLAE